MDNILQLMLLIRTRRTLLEDSMTVKRGKYTGYRWNDDNKILQYMVSYIKEQDDNLSDEEATNVILNMSSSDIVNAIDRALSRAASVDYFYKYEKEW